MKAKEKKVTLLTLTRQNIKDLKSELKELVYVKRKELLVELKEARSQGDLSENSRYDAAKQKQIEIEERIAEINALLKNAVITNQSRKKVVSIGKKVKLLDLKTNQEMEFTIGTIFDIDVEKNIISNVSSLAKAILKHKEGDKILVKGKDILMSYWIKILKIEG